MRKQFSEPRIHVALVCAAMSCPPLRTEPYYGNRLDEQLDDQSRKFLNSPKGLKLDKDRQSIKPSKIFDWFKEDFADWGSAAAPSNQQPPRRGVLMFLAQYVDDLEAKDARLYKIDGYLDYDWSLNEQSHQ